MNSYFHKLAKKGNNICVGLDPDLNKFPEEYKHLPSKKAILSFLKEIITITAPYAAAYKIQKAFLDLYSGPKLLKDIITMVHRIAPGKPVIVDCKIGDTTNTMQAYLKNIFKYANADAIVINPYMGEEVFHALSIYPERGIVVLVKTSNPGSSLIQNLTLKTKTIGHQQLWEYLLIVLIKKFNKNKNIIPVLSDHPKLNTVRKVIPQNMPILYAGVGAQGVNLQSVHHLFNKNKGGVIVNSSRALLYPYSPKDPQWKEKVLEAIKILHQKIANIRDKQ